MLSKFLNFSTCTLVIKFFCACTNLTPTNNMKANDNKSQALDINYQRVGYDTTILLVDRKCETCETWDAFFNIKEFINIYEHSNLYMTEALLFLSNDKYTDRQKKTCICSMQRTTIENYIKICKQCKDLFDTGKVTESILAWAIAPNFSNRYLIVRNFNNENVKILLQSVKDDPKVSTGFKDTVETILSGVLWNNIKESNGI